MLAYFYLIQGMTKSHGVDDVGQEFYASYEGGTTGRDAANLESIYHVDLDDIVNPNKQKVNGNSRIDNEYDDGDQDYTDLNAKDREPLPKDIKFYGAKDFSKKIKEELGKHHKRE